MMDKKQTALEVYFDYALSIAVTLRESGYQIINLQIVEGKDDFYRLLIDCVDTPPSPPPSTSATNEPPRDGVGG